MSRFKAFSRVDCHGIERSVSVESVLSTPARKAAYITCFCGQLDTADSSLHHLLLIWATRGVSRVDLCSPSQGSSASAHAPACWSLVTGQPHTHQTAFTGSGVCTTAQMATSQRTCGQYSSTQAVWAALKDCLAFGTYFPAGVALTEPPWRRNRPAVLLAVHCVTEDQPHLSA